jgi:hypothetical protein
MKKRIIQGIGIAILGFCIGWAHGQSCSTTSPCVQVPITNSNALPSATALWTCVGVTTSNCTQAQLDTARAGQTASSLCPTPVAGAAIGNWKCIQFSQTLTPQNYNDPHSWGSTINYSSQGTTAAGGVSATSPIITFQMPSQAQVPVVGSPVLVVTGQVGLQ